MYLLMNYNAAIKNNIYDYHMEKILSYTIKLKCSMQNDCGVVGLWDGFYLLFCI